ncbi:prephenate dehydrogenase [Stieleria varia]|uniref:Prephenate dehydrogenase n=1 Tax=Stieleria varia TaxID=2528005 RepID=A0A5C6B1Z0_9BACT|nr:prephenate dehydrogenase/arogenate dehydrogenase family protein [Stieleria varia]TWU06335.1 prephenate dehydrogenase [Stieleria varia]
MASDTASDFIPRRVAILGVGLLGGSVARALRRHQIDVVGYSRTPETRAMALQQGVVTEAYASLADACEGCDVVVVASPVDRIADMVLQAAPFIDDGALITDVGSTKALIVHSVAKDQRAAEKFVAAHPIAGSEKTGVEHSRSDLFDNKMIVITPGPSNSAERLLRCEQFWRLTGGQTVRMTPAIHDQQLAAISHVPHLISSLLACLPAEEALPLVGSGWSDMTRVASGDPTMWTAICQHNSQAIVDQIGTVIAQLQSVQQMVAASDQQALHDWLAAAKSRKDRTQSSETR